MNIAQQSLFKLILCGILLGCGTIIIKLIDSNALAAAFWRLFFAAMVLGVGLLVCRVPLKVSPKRLLNASLAGFFLALDLFLWHESILSIGPGIATILNSIQVFIMAGFSFVLYGQRLGPFFIGQLLLAFVGVVLLTGHEFEHNQAAVYGVITGLLSGLAFALSMLFTSKMQINTSRSGLWISLYYLSLVGALSLLPFALGFGFELTIPDVNTLVGLLIYAVVIHIFGWILLSDSIRHVPLSLTGLVMLLEPTVALLLDVVVLDKTILLMQWLGAFITITAIYLGTLSRAKKQPATSPKKP